MTSVLSPELKPPALLLAPRVAIPGYKSSETVAEVFGALILAQAAFAPITKDNTATVLTKAGKEYQYQYADLGAVIEATRPALAAQGLGVTQSIESTPTAIRCSTVLVHKSGEWMAQELTLPAGEAANPQAIASVITYARRYSMSLLLGVASVEDDDGAAATGGQRPQQQRQQQRKADPKREEKPAAPSAFDQLRKFLHKEYLCQNPEDSSVILMFALNDRSKDWEWMKANTEQAATVQGSISKWCVESGLTPAVALQSCKDVLTADEAFPPEGGVQ